MQSLILLFCLIAGAILVMGAIMILSPGVEILGLRYASYNSQKVVNKITYNNEIINSNDRAVRKIIFV